LAQEVRHASPSTTISPPAFVARAMQSEADMRALVTWGSKHGGTAGIGQIIARALTARGIEVVAASVDDVAQLDGFDAVIVGGALYANTWPANVRRFVNRHVAQLRRVPVWFFSSGPLDDSAERQSIPAPTQVAVLAERVGARDHVTFGGRLEANVKGFPASAMAKTRAGDWRNPESIEAWAAALSGALPDAKPGVPIDHPAHSAPRLLAHGVVGWALCALTMAALVGLLPLTAALVSHALVAPLFFFALARHYFRARGAREPLSAAITWTATVMLLDLIVVAGIAQRSLAMFASVAGTWLPFALIFLATWATGSLMATMPWPTKPAEPGAASPGPLLHEPPR
jgi:menaquinone-dependent protoporphyrinogen oxidase